MDTGNFSWACKQLLAGKRIAPTLDWPDWPKELWMELRSDGKIYDANGRLKELYQDDRESLHRVVSLCWRVVPRMTFSKLKAGQRFLFGDVNPNRRKNYFIKVNVTFGTDYYMTIDGSVLKHCPCPNRDTEVTLLEDEVN